MLIFRALRMGMAGSVSVVQGGENRTDTAPPLLLILTQPPGQGSRGSRRSRRSRRVKPPLPQERVGVNKMKEDKLLSESSQKMPTSLEMLFSAACTNPNWFFVRRLTMHPGGKEARVHCNCIFKGAWNNHQTSCSHPTPCKIPDFAPKTRNAITELTEPLPAVALPSGWSWPHFN